MAKKLIVKTNGQGLYEITSEIQRLVAPLEIGDGLCTIFITHTSASLLIQENADPSARYDLERWLRRLVPENDPHFTHTFEGPDDMPGHIKASLTATNLSVPIVDGELALGTWQGIYVWEHRDRPHDRTILVQTLSN
ncbi:MAG: secondary thiamine-phosphate synthase enzyme YjbQ [Bdellovibrionales bacterium]|nr:secondary thiamine-phosphate synthase enzyme YjbQ [Bdellovibrionales bacterium]